MPMQLYLYNYENADNIEEVLSWRPTEKQWWITGFNPDYVGNVNGKSRNMPPYILVFIWSLKNRKHCEKIRY